MKRATHNPAIVIENPKPKNGRWTRITSLNTKWDCLWAFKCPDTGLTATLRFSESDPRPLEKLLSKPADVIRHGHTVELTDERQRVVAKWRPIDGKLTINSFLVVKDGRSCAKYLSSRRKDGNDTVIRAGYGLRQAMRMAYLVLAEEGLLYDREGAKSEGVKSSPNR